MTYRMTHGPRPAAIATKSSQPAPRAYKASPTVGYATRQSHAAPVAYKPKTMSYSNVMSTLKGILGADSDGAPPPAAGPNWPAIVGWAAVVVTGTGIFWAVTRGGSARAVAANRRRTSRRRPRRRASRRRVSRNLSAAARRRISKSDFVFPERRAWPLDSKKRAKAAISYLHMGRVSGKSEYLAIRNAIIRKYGMSFWRDSNGPSWSKVEKAKSKRRRSRKSKRKTSRRKVAANRRRTRRKARWATYVRTRSGNWIEKSRHGTMRRAEDAADKLIRTGRYMSVGVDRPGRA